MNNYDESKIKIFFLVVFASTQKLQQFYRISKFVTNETIIFHVIRFHSS